MASQKPIRSGQSAAATRDAKFWASSRATGALLAAPSLASKRTPCFLDRRDLLLRRLGAAVNDPVFIENRVVNDASFFGRENDVNAAVAGL